jgi:serine protease AprX
MEIKLRKALPIFLLGFSIVTFAQTAEQRKQIVKEYDLEKLKSLENKLSKKYFSRKSIALTEAKTKNWATTTINKQGNYTELVAISEEGKPLYYTTHNAGSATTARVNRINEGGSAGLKLDGQNMVVGIWDGGPVRTTHQALTGRVIVKDGVNFSTSNESTEHGTHVSGTMVGSGVGSAQAKGLASKATLWANTFANDEAEVIVQASEGLLVSNHSYGLEIAGVPTYYMGAYIDESKEWDDIMYNAPYFQAVISAGNDRGSTQDKKGGRDLLIGNKNSKNAVVVAAVNQVTNYVGPESVVMSSFSSWGPTDDFRIKPDISAKGVGVYSLSSASDTSYKSQQGTSMAAPAVSSSLLLMQQHYYEKQCCFYESGHFTCTYD